MVSNEANIGLSSNSGCRMIPLEGIFNFRDMGGYQTEDGRRVKYGLLFRSAELAGMTESDRQQLLKLGISTILDYRDEGEAVLKPDPFMEGVDNIRIPAMRSETAMDLEMLIRNGHFDKITAEKFAELYTLMTVNNPSFKRLMAVFAESGKGGILQHCAAGRDRTGVGSAFLLLALGVSRETIIEDYLISNKALEPMFAQLKQQLGDVLSLKQAEQIFSQLELRREWMEAVFHTIDDQYGGTAPFMEQEFGLTAEKLDELRRYYLEEAS